MEVGDFALLMLNSAPPAGTAFLGWSVSDMPFNQRFLGLHYPRGSWRRIALGSRTPDRIASVSGQQAPANFFYQMAYSLGLTEGGSSGSPIMSEAGVLYGTLSYGPAAPNGRSICDSPTQTAGYGRFTIGSAFTYFTKFRQNFGGGTEFSVLNTSGYNTTFPSVQFKNRAGVAGARGIAEVSFYRAGFCIGADAVVGGGYIRTKAGGAGVDEGTTADIGEAIVAEK